MDQIHNYILALICFLPLLFIVFSNAWKEADFAEKLVMGGLLVWAVASCFSRHMCIQFYCGFAAIALFHSIKKRYFRAPGPLTYLFFAYFIWHAISLLWTKDVISGLFQLRVYSLFIFIPLTFCCFSLSKSQSETVMTGFFRTISLFLAATLCTWIVWCVNNNCNPAEWIKIQKHIFNSQPSFTIIYAWSNYNHPTYNGIPILIGMAIGFFKANRKFSWDGIHYVETALYSVAALIVILLSQSRICLIGWFLILILGVLYKLKEKKKVTAISAAATIVLCIACIYLWQERVDNFTKDPIRIQNLTTAKYYIENNPILGSGIEGIREVMDSDETAQLLGFQQANKDLGNPHHQFVGDWMQTGIPGMALSLAIFIVLFYIAIKRRDFVLFSTMVLMLLIANIEMPFYLHKGVVQFLLFTGWFTSSYGIAGKEQ